MFEHEILISLFPRMAKLQMALLTEGVASGRRRTSTAEARGRSVRFTHSIPSTAGSIEHYGAGFDNGLGVIDAKEIWYPPEV